MTLENITKKVNFIPTPAKAETVEVNFEGGLVDDFAATYCSAMNNKLELRGSSKEFNAEKMDKYLNFLLQERINFTTGGKTSKKSKYLLIPALYALALTHVGYVFDKELGITLKPKTDLKKDDILTEDEAIAFSNELRLVEDLGFELVEGIPRDIKGSVDFMYFQMTETEIMRHSNTAAPSYAVLAAFFRMKRIEDVLTFRVSYGLISEYEEMLTGLIYDEAR